jgi:hypothetical protein
MRPTRWLALAAALLLAACGSDGDGDSGQRTDEDTLTDALLDLSDRSQTTLDSPEAQFLQINGEAPFDILSRFLPSDAILPLQIARKLDEPRELGELVLAAPKAFLAARALARLKAAKGVAYPPFGTYQYAPGSLDPNFPDWELVAADVPADGYVFEFDFTDGFTAIGPLGNEVPVAGEIRALNVAWNEFAEATNFVFEIAVRTPVQTLLTTIFRLPVELAIDSGGTTGTIQIGDAEANSPNITAFPDVCFLGNALFAFHLEVTKSSASIAFQAYDSAEEYVIGFAVDAEGDPQTDDFTLVSGRVYFGQTEDPSSPEWEGQLTLTTTEPLGAGPIEPIVYVSGRILHRNREIATLSGTTTEIPIDIDGNGTTDPNENCGDVDIVFADDPENPINICRWLYLHSDDFAPAKLSRR